MERALAWLSGCRAILVRYDRKVSNYIGLIQLACVNADEELIEIADGDLTHISLLSLHHCLHLALTHRRSYAFLCVIFWHQEDASRGPSEHRILQQARQTHYPRPRAGGFGGAC